MSTIYLDLDPVLAQAMADQRLTIADLLDQAGVDAQLGYAIVDPLSSTADPTIIRGFRGAN